MRVGEGVGKGVGSPSKFFISGLLKVPFFGSSQAIIQMITTSSKLSILFLFKGKIILYQLSVRKSPA